MSSKNYDSQSENLRDDLNNDVQDGDAYAPLFTSCHLVRLRHLVYNLNLTVHEYAVVETAIV